MTPRAHTPLELELMEALADTLLMLHAAHMSLGMDHLGKNRVKKAREILARAKGNRRETNGD